MQAGVAQALQVTVTPQNGFTGTVSVAAPAVSAGITVSPTTLSITPGAPSAFSFSASGNAPITQQTFALEATSGSLTASTSFEVNITGAAISDPYYAVGGSMVHGFYDESRQMLFATNLGLNEVDVISGQDFSIKARVPVPQPLGIDQMGDGNTIVIGTEAQELVTIDEDTYAVTSHPFSAAGTGGFTLFFPTVVALANGKVLAIGQEQGIDSSDIVDGGQYIYVWDSNANTFSQLEPNPQNPNDLLWETDSLARSADHKWAVFAGDQFYLYSSDSNSLSTAAFVSVNPPENEFGVRGYAVNADGSEIAVVSADQVVFLNSSLQVLGITPISGAFQTSRSAVKFSPDGSKLFLEYALPLSIEELDAHVYTDLGSLSGTVIPDEDNLERLLDVDSQGRGYVGIDSGLRIVNLTQSPEPPSAINPDPYACPELDTALPLSTSKQVPLSFAFKDASVYVGGQPAPLTGDGTAVNIPASTVSGPADVECIDTYGNEAVVLNGVSYGVKPYALGANLLPATGNPTTYLFGFGFQPSSSSMVTLGGESVASFQFSSGAGFGMLDGDAIEVPNGTAGQPVNGATVSSAYGSGTLSSPIATYYAAPTIVPASGIAQLTFDPQRNRLYALKASEVDVLDAASLQWESPLTIPAAATGSLNTMELTPDGSKLVVGGLTGANPEIVVLDPDNNLPPSVIPITRGGLYGSFAITEFNTVVMPGSPGAVLDLATSTFTGLPYWNAGVIRASPDGSCLYTASLNNSGGQVSSVDPATYALQSESFAFLFWTDLAVSPDCSRFAAVDAPPGAAGDLVGFFNSSLQYINSNAYPDFSPPDDSGVIGVTFSPQGKVLVVPLGDSLEFWDAAKGTLISRVITPAELQVLVYPENAVSPVVALDSAGQTVYGLTANGIIVITLPEPIDDMTPMQWPEVRAVAKQSALRGIASSRAAALGKAIR